MKKVFLIGCTGFIVILLVLSFIIGLIGVGDKNTAEKAKESVELIIDTSQFSRISSAELVQIMGEPEKVEDFEWKIPRTNEGIVGKLYIYDKNKYEFILFDDSVVRLNVYSGSFMGYDNSKMTFDNEEDIFTMFAIEPNENLKKIADTNYALRYSPVSDKVADVWIQEINGNEFGIAKITYNLNYFE